MKPVCNQSGAIGKRVEPTIWNRLELFGIRIMCNVCGTRLEPCLDTCLCNQSVSNCNLVGADWHQTAKDNVDA